MPSKFLLENFFVGPPVFFYRSLILYRRHKNPFRGWEWSRTTGTGLFRSLLYRELFIVPELPQPNVLQKYRLFLRQTNFIRTFFEFEYRVSFITYKFQTLYKIKSF
jgi:hypothetical protein